MKQVLKIQKMRSDIEKAKSRLQYRPIVENFGQDEVRRIADKYSDLMVDYYAEYSNLLQNFSDWCANYTGVKSSVKASRGLRPFIVTWGYDAGGPEDGPKWRKGQEIQYGTSEEDACRRWEEDNHSWVNSPYSGYEGCWAKETTEDIAQEMNRKMHEDQEMMEAEIRSWFPQAIDEDDYRWDELGNRYDTKGNIVSATSSNNIKIPKPYSKYFEVYQDQLIDDDDIQEILDDYGLEYISDVVAQDWCYDELADNGLDIGTLARDESGKVRVYLIAGGSVYDMMGEIEVALSY